MKATNRSGGLVRLQFESPPKILLDYRTASRSDRIEHSITVLVELNSTSGRYGSRFCNRVIIQGFMTMFKVHQRRCFGLARSNLKAEL